MSKEAFEHLQILAEKIGARPKGSSTNISATQYVEKHFINCGLKVYKQEFPSINWKLESIHLFCGNKPLPVLANGFCQSCEICSDYVSAGSFEELDFIEFKDKILVLYGDLTKDELESKPVGEAVYFPAISKKIYDAIEITPPKALIFINHNNNMISLHNDLNCYIPSITVDATTGKEILRDNQKHKIKLSVKSQRNDSKTQNVIATLEGRRQEKIILCSHIDTKFYSPGAFDNGSGMSVLLNLATILSKTTWEYGIEFIAFNGEEFIGIKRGSDHYLDQLGLKLEPFTIGMRFYPSKQFEEIIVAINFDRFGLYLETDVVGAINGSNVLNKLIKDCKQHYPEISFKNAKPMGDHYAFLFHGVPCIHCTSFETMNISHSTSDTIEWISDKKLTQMTNMSVDIIKNIMKVQPHDLRK